MKCVWKKNSMLNDSHFVYVSTFFIWKSICFHLSTNQWWLQRTRYAMITSSLRQKDVAMSFWRNNYGTIASCVCSLDPKWRTSAKLVTRNYVWKYLLYMTMFVHGLISWCMIKQVSPDVLFSIQIMFCEQIDEVFYHKHTCRLCCNVITWWQDKYGDHNHHSMTLIISFKVIAYQNYVWWHVLLTPSNRLKFCRGFELSSVWYCSYDVSKSNFLFLVIGPCSANEFHWR